MKTNWGKIEVVEGWNDGTGAKITVKTGHELARHIQEAWCYLKPDQVRRLIKMLERYAK